MALADVSVFDHSLTSEEMQTKLVWLTYNWIAQWLAQLSWMERVGNCTALASSPTQAWNFLGVTKIASVAA